MNGAELATYLTAGLVERRPYAVLVRVEDEATDRIFEPLTLDEAKGYLGLLADEPTVTRAEIVPRASRTIVRFGHLKLI